jgi:hypothetical protein
MQTKRRQPPDDTPDPSDVTIPLSVVENPSAEDVRAMTPEERIVWRKLRSKFFKAEYCHPRFDPRKLMALPPRQAGIWRAARRQWLKDVVFRGDARVLDA